MKHSVSVVSGDVSRISTDALITAINSGKAWFGGIDGVIQRSAGNHFHAQAARADLEDGKAIVTKGDTKLRSAFRNVVFVIDDLQRPLHEIVLAGLEAAESEGYTTVSLPTIRMGVMLGVVEKSPKQAVDEMRKGVMMFFERHSDSKLKVTFVVYNTPDVQKLLEAAFAN